MTDAWRPGARIVANGVDITTRLIDPASQHAILVSLTINDEAGIKADKFEMVLDARPGRDGTIFAVPPIGSELEIWLGYEPEPARMGLYRLENFEFSGPPTTMKLSGSSAELTTAIKETKTRSHHDTTVGAIVKKIAGEHGLGVALDEELGGREIPHIDQQTESDMAFLTRIAGRHGATFKLAGGKVVFTLRGTGRFPDGSAKPEIVVRPVDVSTWSVTHSERGGHKSVSCYYMDHGAKKRLKATVGDGSPTHRDKRLYGSKAEAEAAAHAKLGELTRGKREGQFDGPGNPALFAEAKVRIDGFHPEVDATFYAKSVTHSFSASGYTTAVTLESERGGDSD